MTDSEVERLAALKAYEILDTPPEVAFDRITALAADLFGTRIAAISLIDRDRQWFKSAIGLEVRETPREHAFCDHAIRDEGVMEVLDAELDVRFAHNPLVLDDPLIRFYAGAPLTLRSGHRLGALCIIDSLPRPALTEVEKRRLTTLAAIVVNEMDLRLTGERLQLARKAAEAADEAKSEFLANMSHELRTPLTSIIGFAGLLGASPSLGETERRFAEKIQTASRNLLAIVNDVLDLARLDAGNVELGAAPVDVREVAAETLDMVAEQAREKGLSLALHAPDGLPKVSADAPRLRQVLLNLVSNAVKFTQDGSVRIDIASADDQVAVSVTDTGIGIEPDRLEKVFERFVQADDSIGKRFGGTGLGLAISQRLTVAMGGDLSARSSPGHGSTFTVRLPTGG